MLSSLSLFSFSLLLCGNCTITKYEIPLSASTCIYELGRAMAFEREIVPNRVEAHFLHVHHWLYKVKSISICQPNASNNLPRGGVLRSSSFTASIESKPSSNGPSMPAFPPRREMPSHRICCPSRETLDASPVASSP